jgi:hypothetical protein
MVSWHLGLVIEQEPRSRAVDESSGAKRVETREFWEEAIRLWTDSGLSVREFCVREGLADIQGAGSCCLSTRYPRLARRQQGLAAAVGPWPDTDLPQFDSRHWGIAPRRVRLSNLRRHGSRHSCGCGGASPLVKQPTRPLRGPHRRPGRNLSKRPTAPANNPHGKRSESVVVTPKQAELNQARSFTEETRQV